MVTQIFEGDTDDLKPTSGFALVVADGDVSWSGKKQNKTAQLTVLSEYMSLLFSAVEAT